MSDSNPFAPPAAVVEDTIEGLRDEQGRISQEAFYRAAVGPRANGYLRKFAQFNGNDGSRRSWNFAAMIFGFFWFIYRRMYLAAFLVCVVGPTVVLYVPRLVIAGLGVTSPAILSIPTLLYSFVLIPLYADFLYFGSVERRIVNLKEKLADDEEVLRSLQRSKGVSPIAVVVTVLLLMATVFILSQFMQQKAVRLSRPVTEQQIGFASAATELVRTGVVKYYAAHRQWPDDIEDLEKEARPTDPGIEVDLSQGTVSVRFDNRFNAALAGHVLSYRPAASKTGAITWFCGYADLKDSVAPPGPNLTDVPQKLLPEGCRAR